MLYKVVSGATIVIASLSILTQIILLPIIFQYSLNAKNEFQARMRKFHRNARIFDDEVNQLEKIGSFRKAGKYELGEEHHRFLRQLDECSPPYPGPQGPPGDPAPDGEPGDQGMDGVSGMDAYQLLLEEAQKCVECPAGPIGPIGAPGLPGYTGIKGEHGDPGVPGKDGTDGEQGPEGYTGRRGAAGNKGKKGTSGAPAPGGEGPPGPPGVKGPRGSAGLQGERGRRNYVIGPTGPDGRSGKNGMDGTEGKAGPRGEKGEIGETGADAKFCPCPIELSISGGKEKPKSHLAPNTDPKAYASRSQHAQISENKPLPVVAPSNQVPQARTAAAAAAAPPPPPPLPPTQPPQNVASDNTNLGIRPLPVGERKNPTARQPQVDNSDVTAPHLTYEDAYPNYDERNDKGETRQHYDEDVPAATKGSDGESNVSTERNDENADNVPLQESIDKPAEIVSHRRFVYVTKRPRPVN